MGPGEVLNCPHSASGEFTAPSKHQADIAREQHECRACASLRKWLPPFTGWAEGCRVRRAVAPFMPLLIAEKWRRAPVVGLL